jgi:hypothetical protein
MNVKDQIKKHIADQPELKRNDMEALHKLALHVSPKTKLWFLDGKDEKGKFVTNPNIGYGLFTLRYANGTTKDFYQVGFAAHTSGISVYILGLADKTFLKKTYEKKLGKASVTGYCIKFKSLKDINLDVLEDAIRMGLEPRE